MDKKSQTINTYNNSANALVKCDTSDLRGQKWMEVMLLKNK